MIPKPLARPFTLIAKFESELLLERSRKWKTQKNADVPIADGK